MNPVFSALLPLFMLGSALAQAAPALPSNYLPVPLTPQSTSYSCGAATLMAVMEYWNVFDGYEASLFRPLQTTPADGTHPISMSNLARRYGLRSDVRKTMTLADLRMALAEGTTVIVDLQAWSGNSDTDWKNAWEEGHYVVLVAMDAEYAYFMDPSAHGAYAYLTHAELLERWHDYENRNRYVQKYVGLGILIHGDSPRRQFPGPLIKIQ
jgi:predicted double-glycine peptidase